MNAIERTRATYEMKPTDRMVRKEFYIWDESFERWRSEGLDPSFGPEEIKELFGFDEPGTCSVGGLGWCEPQLYPAIEGKVIDEGEDYELVVDGVGRTVKVFKGRRHGFMPTYVKHAVASDADWDENIAPRLSPDVPERWADFDGAVERVTTAAAEGKLIAQHCVGGYMYLRSLVGPEEICYLLIDNPKLVHRMMQGWLELADALTARYQEHVAYDILFLAEDICFNHGLLISPDMVREFIFPYYQQLLDNMRSRQDDRKLYLQVDTDGYVAEAIDLYREIGLDVMLPMEIAAGNDVVEIGKKYPDLVISGGIDKRVLAEGPDAIDKYLEHVIPFFVERGGYIPTCDHGVPDNVSFDSYMHYRKRIMELDH